MCILMNVSGGHCAVESNPGLLGENQESLPLDHMDTETQCQCHFSSLVLTKWTKPKVWKHLKSSYLSHFRSHVLSILLPVHLSGTLRLSWRCQMTSIKTQFEASILDYLHISSTVSTMGNDCGLSSHLLPALQGPSATLMDLSWMLIRKEANCCPRNGHRWELQNQVEVQLI